MKSKQHGGSCIYVKTNLKAKSCNLFEYLNQEEHFEASITELTQLNTVVKAPTLLRQMANRLRQGCQPYTLAALYPQVSLFLRFLVLISVRG
jgi:hypothetical protein